MFERWIKLFGDPCGELFEEPVAEAFRAMATRIAESLKFALSASFKVTGRKRHLLVDTLGLLLNVVHRADGVWRNASSLTVGGSFGRVGSYLWPRLGYRNLRDRN